MDTKNNKKEIKYVMYPKNFMAQRPEIDARQAEIYCHQCATWQPLNIENYKTLPFGCDNHKIRYYHYPNGRCCRPECEDLAQFWAQEAYLHARCDAANAKCEATNQKHNQAFSKCEQKISYV